MATRLIRSLQRASLTSCIQHFSNSNPHSFRSISRHSQSILSPSQSLYSLNPWIPPPWGSRNSSHGTVNLVISQGKPKFETHEIEPPKKEKFKNKKRFKMQKKREKQKRKSMNKRDPRCLGVKGKKKKQKFPDPESRIKYKIEKAKIKEGLLIERLKKYEVSKLQGPVPEPDEDLTGEERFFMKKMAQKGSNYVPVGRRGVFGGVILNMHLHWKKHETVKVICKPCKPGQVHQYAEEIARLSGGIPIHVIGDDTIIFYRGKNYVQPEIMSPIDTLSKKRALEKSKYEQSLESVRRFIAIAEKELELYYRHVALYGDPNNRSIYSTSSRERKGSNELRNPEMIEGESTDVSEKEFDSTDNELYPSEGDSLDEDLSGSEVDLDDEGLSDSEEEEEEEEEEEDTVSLTERSYSSTMVATKWD